MSSIGDDKVVVLIGKRETGKSFLVKDMMYHHQDIPIGTVISATEHANKFYGNMVPNIFIHHEFSPAIVSNVLKRQHLILKRCRKEIKQTGGTDIDPRAFLIMDDCLADSNAWQKDKNIRSCFMNGRHYKLFFVLTSQYALGLGPQLRTNVDYAFILRENIISNRRRIYESYCGMFPTFELFCQVLDQTTEDYSCLVINNNAKSNKLEDQVFWYKAESHPNFRMGSPHFWQIQAEAGSDSSDEEEMFDVSAYKGKKRHPQVNVKKSLM
jgi:hypothetical protein